MPGGSSVRIGDRLAPAQPMHSVQLLRAIPVVRMNLFSPGGAPLFAAASRLISPMIKSRMRRIYSGSPD
jgi:hypothetical protein